MDDGRLNRFADEFLAREGEDTPSPPSAEPARNRLTHRPRAQQRLDADAIEAALQTEIKTSADCETQTDADDVSGQRPPDLRPFADQLIAIAEQLRTGDFGLAASVSQEVTAKLTGRAERASPPDIANAEGATRNAAQNLDGLDLEERRKTFAHMARTAYAKRRKRTSIFGDPELFGEPGWDILLDLYIAHVEGKPVSVSSACIGSASPPTTGLRWLGVLTEQGFIAREHDPLDQRRVLVRLTDKALDAMDAYFSSSANLYGDRRAARA
ncbi:MAG: hypothetical protein AAFZ11_10815 [Pseudomonadota bacterium]